MLLKICVYAPTNDKYALKKKMSPEIILFKIVCLNKMLN